MRKVPMIFGVRWMVASFDMFKTYHNRISGNKDACNDFVWMLTMGGEIDNGYF